MYGISSSAVLINNIFRDNTSIVAGGAIYSEYSSLDFINNTLYKNSSINFTGGIVLIYNSRNFIQNNIFYKNTSRSNDPRIYIASADSSVTDTSYNYLAFGSMDPNFISETDLHLEEISPCINAGNPDPIYNDTNGSRNDQGACGGPGGDW